MPVTTKKGVATAPKTEVAEKTAATVAAEAPVTEEQVNAECGKLSDKLTFIAALGDPSRDDVTVKEVNGKQVRKVDPTIVGYRFVADIDLEVPDCKPGDDIKDNLMSFTGDPYNTRHVPAGTQFDLTKFETGALISRVEFNGKALGGERQVVCAYTSVAKKTSNGQIAKTSSAVSVPTIALRALSGSIKDYEMIPVLTFKKEVGNQGQTKKVREIIPGFEKWEGLCKEAVRRTSARGTSAAKTNARNKGAAAFLQIMGAQKKAK